MTNNDLNDLLDFSRQIQDIKEEYKKKVHDIQLKHDMLMLLFKKQVAKVTCLLYNDYKGSWCLKENGICDEFETYDDFVVVHDQFYNMNIPVPIIFLSDDTYTSDDIEDYKKMWNYKAANKTLRNYIQQDEEYKKFKKRFEDSKSYVEYLKKDLGDSAFKFDKIFEGYKKELQYDF